jgi:hypothetical protein
MENHLNQSYSYNINDSDKSIEEIGKVEDDIIAITLRIVINVYLKLHNTGRS